ncbi:MAG TPA: class I SAM-dependent methyltransferase [Gemmatimonadota bacterium]|nr:class I SAM-dependent methyltransferase [Gemmatimonadota bacterium]
MPSWLMAADGYSGGPAGATRPRRERDSARGALDFGVGAKVNPAAGENPTEVFGPLAEEYARFRPSYPDALFDELLGRLGHQPGATLDLGAGTGAATASLLRRGARVVALEPNRSMLGKATARLAGAAGWLGAVAARAEEVPIASASVACITVAQAFHWFEPELALAEFARVLRPRGLLALMWNVVVPDAFTDEVFALVARHNPSHGRPVTRRMLATPEPLARHPAFDVAAPAEFAHERTMNEDAYVGYAFSWSYCGGALAGDSRSAFERELREVIRRHRPEGSWPERLVAVAHFAARLPR